MQDEPVGVTSTTSATNTEENDSRGATQPGSPLSSFAPDYTAFPDHLCDLQPGRRPQHPGPRCSHLPDSAADAASPPSINPSKIQMDSPIAHHHINGNSSGGGVGGGGSGSGLSGGLSAAFPNLPGPELQSTGSSSPSLPGFGTPWSVQTSSSPPPPAPPPPPPTAPSIHQMPNTDSDSGFYPGIPSSINPAFFQSFSPVSANPCAGINVQGFSGPFSPQINVPQQAQSRRSPVSPQLHPQQGAFLQQRNNYNQHQVSSSNTHVTLKG